MTFYAPEKIGETRYRTPEGFLVCVNVPIARTGTMVYGPGEVPVEPGRDGIIRIDRDEAEVFSDRTISSFLGKPVTDDHPDEDVTPENWRDLAKGEVHNPRRGTGIWDDCLVADLFIKDAEAIKAIEGGKVEVSCGYDADYEQLEAGKGRQHNIIGNHVALVENGRCGPRCAIGDKAMAKRTFRDKVRDLLGSRRSIDEQIEKALEEGQVMDEEEAGSGATHVHVHLNGATPEAKAADVPAKDEGEAAEGDPMDKRVGQLEVAIASIADTVSEISKAVAKMQQAEQAEAAVTTGDEEGEKEDEDGEGEKTADEDVLEEGDVKEGKTVDSAGLLAEFNDTKARAEIIAPGIKFPTLDAKVGVKKVRDNLCALRRKALTTGLASDHGAIIRPLVTDVKTMTCDGIKAAFVGASELVRNRNNDRGIGYDRATRDASKVQVRTITEINKANQDFWAARS